MEDLKNDINYVSNDVKAYVNAEIQLGKMEAIDHISQFSASIFSWGILVILAIVSYIMLLLALGFYLDQFFVEAWMGFAVSFGISVLVILLVRLFNSYVLEGPIQDFVIANLSKRILS